MKIPEELKLNKFKEVRIPSKSEYMQRLGGQNVPMPYSGDELTTAAQRLTDQMADYMAWEKEMAAEAAKQEPAE